MDCGESRRSVMTRLMGVDEVPKLYGSIQKPRQVISESYLRRLASIGVGKKRPFHDRHSGWRSLKGNEEFKPKPDFGLSPRPSLVSKGLRGGVHSVSTMGLQSPRSSASRRRTEFGYFEPLRKTENNIVIADTQRSKTGAWSPRKRSGVLEELRWQGTKGSSLGFRGGERSKFSTPFSSEKLLGSETKEKLTGMCSMTRNYIVGQDSRVGTMDTLLQGRVSRPRNHKLGNGKGGFNDVFDLRKLPKQRAKYEAFRSKWNLQSGDVFDLRKLPKQKAKYKAIRSMWDLQSEKSLDLVRLNPRTHKSTLNNEVSEHQGTKLKFATPKSFPCSSSGDSRPYSVSVVDNMLINGETEFAENPSEESLSSALLEDDDDDCSSRATDSSVQQEKSLSLREESPGLCARMKLDSLVILEETYQPSPVSVLEPPFSEDTIYDLGIQLELLKSETYETNSEGPEMAVSSDDESEQGLAKENVTVAKILGVEERRNFSYLIEVVNKASLNRKNLVECPIKLSVFETLEKKYCEQDSWTRSERRLLFDRVNTGLVEILSTCVGVPTWAKSVSKRYSFVRDEGVVEEDLWKLLVGQEKDCSKLAGENVVGSEFGKLDLGEEITAIGSEIERWLFDELLAEPFS